MKIDWDNDAFHAKLLKNSKGLRVEYAPETDKLRVQSRSDPEKDYEVKMKNDEPEYCPCVGFSYRNVCVHCVAAEVFLRRERGETVDID